MSNDSEDIGHTTSASDQAQGEMFGEAPPETGQRIKYPEKLAELEREFAMRKRVYPGLIDRGKLTPERAERQQAVLAAIIEDYNVRPWPQTQPFVAEWRKDADGITFMGIRINRMHREELLAVVAYCKAALETMAEKTE